MVLDYTTSGPTNSERASKAEAALDAYARITRHDPAEQEVTDAESAREILGDFMTDLHHFCAEYGIPFAALAAMAQRGWAEEVAEDTEAPVCIAVERTTVTLVTLPAADLDAAAEDWEPVEEPADLTPTVKAALERLVAPMAAAQEPDDVIESQIVSVARL
jgi:hypothetical protein